MTLKAELIKQARNLLMRALELVYPSGLTAKYLYQIVCAVDPVYDFQLMRKDIAYLFDKGYATIVTPGKAVGELRDVRDDSLTVIKLTATGLEIAQELRDDPALEI